MAVSPVPPTIVSTTVPTSTDYLTHDETTHTSNMTGKLRIIRVLYNQGTVIFAFLSNTLATVAINCS